MERGTALLDELTEGALRAQAALGDPPPWMPVLEHETRIHSHDILSPHHEKGYRCLRAFPPASLRKLRLQFWRVTPSKASKLDHLVGVDAGPDAPLLTFLVWREHLRLVWHEDPEVERRLDRFEAQNPEVRVVRMRPGLVFKREASQGIRRLFGGPFFLSLIHISEPTRPY